MKWLITAFEPFDRAETNSSLIVARELERSKRHSSVKFHYPVPVTFAEAWPSVETALKKHPDVDGVLALGQAEPRSRISLERVALNWIDARIADNSGARPRECKVQAGPDIYWSQIPWQTFALPANCELSYSAGTFVCNALMFQIMDWASKNRKLGGFVHIPVLKSQIEKQFDALPKMDDTAALSAIDGIIKFLADL